MCCFHPFNKRYIWTAIIMSYPKKYDRIRRKSQYTAGKIKKIFIIRRSAGSFIQVFLPTERLVFIGKYEKFGARHWLTCTIIERRHIHAFKPNVRTSIKHHPAADQATPHVRCHSNIDSTVLNGWMNHIRKGISIHSGENYFNKNKYIQLYINFLWCNWRGGAISFIANLSFIP